MKEIIYPKIEVKKEYSESEHCPCGGKIYRSRIPCPEGKTGCLVLHYGWVCEECGRIYQ